MKTWIQFAGATGALCMARTSMNGHPSVPLEFGDIDSPLGVGKLRILGSGGPGNGFGDAVHRPCLVEATRIRIRLVPNRDDIPSGVLVVIPSGAPSVHRYPDKIPVGYSEWHIRQCTEVCVKARW